MRHSPFVAVTALLLAVGLAGANLPATSIPSASAAECPEVVPTDELSPGMTLTGWTVRSGTTRESFGAKVIGVLENGLLPGRDIIVVRTYGSIFDGVDGVWAGMSGSPLYLGDRLVGAVAYGFSAATSPIAGVTPAEDMVSLVEEPAPIDVKISLTKPLRRDIAAATGMAPADVPFSLRPLRVPLGISGGGPDGAAAVRKILKKAGMRAIAFPAGSAPAEPAFGSVEPGDSIASAMSYGDYTVSASGTATYVCGDQVVAFGHSLFGSWPPGETTLGMSEAPVLSLILDPNWGSFKLTQIGGPIGIFNQDRYSGEAGYLSTDVTGTAVETHVTDLDSARVRDGSSTVFMENDLFFLTGIVLMLNMYSVGDRALPGTSELTYEFQGTREDGTPWSLTRENSYVSLWDIADQTTWELSEVIDVLQKNRFEEIAFDSIDLTVGFTDAVRRFKIRKVTVSGAGYDDAKESEISVPRGAKIELEVTLQGPNGQTVISHLSLKAPKRAGYGTIEITGGADVPKARANDLDSLLASWAGARRNDEIVARLLFGPRSRQKMVAFELIDGVVTGARTIGVTVN